MWCQSSCVDEEEIWLLALVVMVRAYFRMFVIPWQCITRCTKTALQREEPKLPIPSKNDMIVLNSTWSNMTRLLPTICYTLYTRVLAMRRVRVIHVRLSCGAQKMHELLILLSFKYLWIYTCSATAYGCSNFTYATDLKLCHQYAPKWKVYVYCCGYNKLITRLQQPHLYLSDYSHICSYLCGM